MKNYLNMIYDKLKDKQSKDILVYGKRNYNKLMESLVIPDVSVHVTQCWALPIYKIGIIYVD